jgi:uncharacterized protein YdhG (YjbR/CyaY superfamily)
MSDESGDRTRYFAAIERKHGLAVGHWLELLSELGEAKYPEQMALLQEGHGFSRTHANAVVMYHRGSTSSRRYAGHAEWMRQQSPEVAATARALLAAITSRVDGLDSVIAWNQPVLRHPGGYVIGCSAASRHLTLNPFSKHVIDAFRDRLARIPSGRVSKHTFIVPIGWEADGDLLVDLVTARIDEFDRI